MLFNTHAHPDGRKCKWNTTTSHWKYLARDGSVRVCTRTHEMISLRMPKPIVERRVRFVYPDMDDVGPFEYQGDEEFVATSLYLDGMIAWLEERVVYEPEPWEVVE